MAKLKLTNAIAEDLKTAASDSFIDSLKMIEIEDIQPNEDNFYEMSEIEELAEDIERQGLMSVLIVETAENGKYRLISGHRRLTAIKRLVDEGRYKSTTVPCYVKSAKSHEETQLDLIMMNATQRKYSDADTMREYEELERIFKALDEAGKPVKGKMRDNIAKVLNVSPAQVAKGHYYMSLLFVLMTREKQQADGVTDDTIYDFDFKKEDFEEFMKTVNENSCRWGDTFVIKTAVETSPEYCPGQDCKTKTKPGCKCASYTDEEGKVHEYCKGHPYCPKNHTKLTVKLYTVKDYYGKEYPEIYNFTENEKKRYEASKAIIQGMIDYWEGGSN